ncbi:hypothetical protein H7I42_05820 [Mycolicibacterium vanbaalenii PYR-1]|uniref:Uncharacterized protein n=2 Tax=Mycolicibacterium vanbaalenii TaxID=110539 RepID=A1THV3_MYCVP|nr:hypothetical protein Mvan_5998 [Mycolicibacterium vanbaalenii PYR-1]MCV7126969.1 hypothetical protein [Mycolicibacterium vanbaalenii PYR-1]
MTIDSYSWRGSAVPGRPTQWVDGPSNMRVAIAAGAPAVIVGVDTPTGTTPDALREMLPKLVDDADWVQRALAGGSPELNPPATAAVHTLALLDDAKVVDDAMLTAQLIDLDKALTLQELGADSEASGIVAELPNATVEVVELLHDAGVATEFSNSLCRLIDLALPWYEHRDALEALRADIGDPKSASGTSVEAEIPLRDALDLAPPPGFLAGERTGEAKPEAPEHISLLARRYARLATAAARVPDIDPNDIAQRLLGQLPRETEQQDVEADQVMVAFLETCTIENAEPAPMLSELVTVLLMMRRDLGGALEHALARDANQLT